MKFGIREFVFVIVLLAMPISSYWFVFRPQNDEIEAAKKEISHKEATLNQLAVATAQIEDLQRENDELSAAIGEAESRLPSTKEVEVILEQVADLAKASRLSMSRVKTGKPESAASYMAQPIEMSVSGNHDDFYDKFLREIEKLERTMRMLDLKIERNDRENGTMRATFTLAIYFEPGPTGRSS